jgi:Ca2+-binding RTX toxin-like protein
MLLLTVMAAVLVMASGVALAVARSGGPGNDTLRGTDGTDALEGNGGNDDLLGLGGTDALSGGKGRDALLGGNERAPQGGDKALAGGPGGDAVLGGRGLDALSGGPGDDYLFEGGLFDRRDQDLDAMAGGDGRDAIVARNVPAASRDVIDCGRGFDRVVVDDKDVTDNCERKFTSFRKFFNSIRGEGYFGPLRSL